MQRRVGGDGFDGAHQHCGRLVLAQMFQHHHARPEGADRVGEALAHDVEGRAVDRFEHRWVAAFGIDIAGGRDAETAGQGGGEIGKDIGVQIGGNQGVERSRAVDHARGGGIDQFLVPGDVGKFAAHFQRDLVPHHHRVTLCIRFGDHRQMLARPRLRQLEGEALDAGHAGARHDRDIGGDFDRMALVRAPADTGILALGIFANNHPVQVIRPEARQR